MSRLLCRHCLHVSRLVRHPQVVAISILVACVLLVLRRVELGLLVLVLA